jgi:hypothetical protein
MKKEKPVQGWYELEKGLSSKLVTGIFELHPAYLDATFGNVVFNNCKIYGGSFGCSEYNKCSFMNVLFSECFLYHTSFIDCVFDNCEFHCCDTQNIELIKCSGEPLMSGDYTPSWI